MLVSDHAQQDHSWTNNTQNQYLFQQLNLALVSADPVVVSQAWEALAAARHETEQVRHQAEVYAMGIRGEAQRLLTAADAQVRNEQVHAQAMIREAEARTLRTQESAAASAAAAQQAYQLHVAEAVAVTQRQASGAVDAIRRQTQEEVTAARAQVQAQASEAQALHAQLHARAQAQYSEAEALRARLADAERLLALRDVPVLEREPPSPISRATSFGIIEQNPTVSFVPVRTPQRQHHAPKVCHTCGAHCWDAGIVCSFCGSHFSPGVAERSAPGIAEQTAPMRSFVVGNSVPIVAALPTRGARGAEYFDLTERDSPTETLVGEPSIRGRVPLDRNPRRAPSRARVVEPEPTAERPVFPSTMFDDFAPHSRRSLNGGSASHSSSSSSSSHSSSDGSNHRRSRSDARRDSRAPGGRSSVQSIVRSVVAGHDECFDLSWSVDDEDTVYRQKDLSLLKLPAFPHSAAEKRAWDSTVASNFASIEKTSSDTLVKWVKVALDPRGSAEEIVDLLHANSQGLNRLDRYLGKLMLDTMAANREENKQWALSFGVYQETCYKANTAPRGRVMMALLSCRYRLDRSRGNVLSQAHLNNIQLQSFKIEDVKGFIESTRLVLAAMDAPDAPTERFMFSWLWEKIKKWPKIAHKIEEVRDSHDRSRKRTFQHLWTLINAQVNNHYEDANFDSIAASLAKPAKLPAAPASVDDKKNKKNKKEKKEKKEKDVSPEVGGMVATGDKGRGKGKKGKQDRVLSKPPEDTDPARRAARAVPPRERTSAQKKILPCQFHCRGTCTRGSECEYSHDKSLIKFESKRLGITPGAAAPAASAGEPAAVDPKPKAQAKTKSKGKAQATVAQLVLGAAAASTGADGAEVAHACTHALPAGGADAALLTAHSLPSPIRSVAKTVRRGFGMAQRALMNVATVALLSPFNLPAPPFPQNLVSAAPAAPSNRVVEISVIGDTGAGRHIGSRAALVNQGISDGLIRNFTGTASRPLTFNTGAGPVDCSSSLGVSSQLLGDSKEIYMLKDSPAAVSIGQIVNEQGRSFVWPTGQLPYFANDNSKFKHYCPLKNRITASRVENNVPMFTEMVTLSHPASAQAAPNYLPGLPANEVPDAPVDSGAELPGGAPLHPSGAGDDDDPGPCEYPDVPLQDESGAAEDLSLRIRRRDRAFLEKEATSARHLMSHYPHNPFCETCRRAHMRQRPFVRSGGRHEEDGLDPVTAPRKMLSTDSIIVAKSLDDRNSSGQGSANINTIRDAFSGMSVAIPNRHRTKEVHSADLKRFAGPAVRDPTVVVKSDADKAITSAVEDLGWHAEPSLENKFPHNAIHERWHATYKSVLRAAMLQSGFPADAWDVAAPYCALALSVTKPAPMLPWELDANGRPLEAAMEKSRQSCWECHHGGAAFTGPKEPFGRLCFFLDRSVHPAMPVTSPALFLGWRLESGLRYRGVLTLGVYEDIRKFGFKKSFMKNIHEKEVFFPSEVCFPFAEANALALRNMSDVQPPLAAPPPLVPLPFGPEAGDEKSPEMPQRAELAKAPRFKITLDRLHRFGPTPHCKVCEEVRASGTHTKACRERFKKLLEDAGEIVADRLVGISENMDDAAAPGYSGADDTVAVPPEDLGPVPAVAYLDGGAAAPTDDEGTDHLHDNLVVGSLGEAPGHEVVEPEPSGEYAPGLEESATDVADLFFGVADLHRGVAATCAQIDSIICDAMAAHAKADREAAARAGASLIRGVAYSTFAEPRPRPSGRRPGWGKAIGIESFGGSSSTNFSDAAKRQGGVTHTVRIDGPSLSSPICLEGVDKDINDTPGCFICCKLPQAGYSEMQWSDPAPSIGRRKRCLQDLRTSSQIITKLMDTFKRCLKSGGEVVFSAPVDSALWARPDIVRIIQAYDLWSTTVNVTEDGGPAVAHRFVCSNVRQAKSLSTLGGAASTPESKLCDTLLRSLYMQDKTAPAMPVVAPSSHPHREHDPPTSDFSPSTLESAAAVVVDLAEGDSQVPGCVTQLLDRAQAATDPQAIAAVRTEADALEQAGTWLLDSVVERDELIQRAKTDGEKIHLGEIMPICSIKHFELDASHHKYKGRICFRGDIVKDEWNKPAIFQEIAASPTTVADINSNVAYGCLPGHSTTQADAVRAYVQATLKSKHRTWIRLPRALWPAAWLKQGFKNPVVLLAKSLYGHPESGAHWEKHLEEAVFALGGVPIEGHKSSYWFSETKLFLTVYVDDLMLSGPSENHKAFWERLKVHIAIDDPEELNRFLGRNHQKSTRDGVSTVAFDMKEYCQDAINMYKKFTGVEKFRTCSTPFLPENSTSEADEQAQGELSASACALLMKQLWVARLARPDLQKAIGDLSSKITSWSRADDRRLLRLFAYLDSTKEFLLSGAVGDAMENCQLELFVDADFGGDHDDVKSTTGAILFLCGPRTRFPLMWLSRRQTSTSRSTTEAEIVALAQGLFSEALPALDLWDTLLQRSIRLEIHEDNEAAIKAVSKGYSQKLRHMNRVHKINISSIHDALNNNNIDISHCTTDEQAADIFTKALAAMKWPAALQLLGVA